MKRGRHRPFSGAQFGKSAAEPRQGLRRNRVRTMPWVRSQRSATPHTAVRDWTATSGTTEN
jgi:hypothetical protein